MEVDKYPDVPPGMVQRAPETLALYEKCFREDDLPEGRLLALRDAIELCAWCSVPPPKWIADAVTELCYAQITADRRPGRLGSYQARLRQYRIHLIRWGAVRHMKDNCREQIRTWSDAYAGAAVALRRTIAQGSEEAMAASYKRQNRCPHLRVIKDAGGVADHAREVFENREFLLDVDQLFRKKGVKQ